jgi:hypothetical protein
MVAPVGPVGEVPFTPRIRLDQVQAWQLASDAQDERGPHALCLPRAQHLVAMRVIAKAVAYPTVATRRAG